VPIADVANTTAYKLKESDHSAVGWILRTYLVDGFLVDVLISGRLLSGIS